MKKEGIQTRNRKLSSKSKKKKGGGCLALGGVMGDIIKPLQDSKGGFGASPFGTAMGDFGEYLGTVSSSTCVIESPESHGNRFLIIFLSS
jgi:hypothetical protein